MIAGAIVILCVVAWLCISVGDKSSAATTKRIMKAKTNVGAAGSMCLGMAISLFILAVFVVFVIAVLVSVMGG